MKKKNNPFKMWGSWIGAVVGWLSLQFLGLSYFNFWYLTIWQSMFPAVSWGAIPPVVISGFLLGWGLEVLFRKNKWFGLRRK